MKILLRFLPVSISDLGLSGLMERASMEVGMTQDEAMALLLAHIEDLHNQVADLSAGLMGKKHALVNRDGSIGWQEDGT